MKKLICFLVVLLFIWVHAEAKIWRVNNTAGVSADFTTAQAAHDAASEGDTIHIEPSVNGYGNMTTIKRLVWLSVGYYLTENAGNQLSTIPGTLGNLLVNSGSENSIFSGMHIAGSISVNCASISVSRCIASAIYVSGDNAVIVQNFVAFAPSFGVFSGITINAQNVLVSNNIVSGGIHTSEISTAVINNNVMNLRNGNGPIGIYNSVFQNNLIKLDALFIFNNSTVSYNFHPTNGLPTGNNNRNNVDMSTVFVNAEGSFDADFSMRAGSSAIGAGFGGIDLGAFSGKTPYRLALQAAIPAIIHFNAPASAVSHIIQGTISAKSNQ